MDAASPRLLLVSPPLDRDDALPALEAALKVAAEVDIAALLLRAGSLDDKAFLARIAAPLKAAQAAGIAVLLADRPDLLAASGADGLHLTLTAKGPRLKDLRARFGEDVILGAGCGASRHVAMTAGEQGADYVGFGGIGDRDNEPSADPEDIAWWEALMTPPQVAFGAADAAEAARQGAAGADFVAAGPALWAAGDDPAQALRALRRALDAAIAADL